MNPKIPARFSVAVEPRSSFNSQSAKAVYSRHAPSRPGYYIIRLRLQHSQMQFRPRLRVL
jgi:hypothetical protein